MSTIFPARTASGALVLPGFANMCFIKPPAAGGTSKAAEIVAAGFDPAGVINRDDIRGELTGDPANNTREAEVTAIANERVEARLSRGRSVLRDSTNLRAHGLRAEIALAHKFGAASVALLRVSDFSFAQLQRRNRSRDRVVPDTDDHPAGNVLKEMFNAHRSHTVQRLGDLGFDLVLEWDDTTVFCPLPDGPDGRHLAGPDDGGLELVIIGDVHGCIHTLRTLLTTNGINPDSGEGLEGRVVVFLGDVNDKGRHSLETLQLVDQMRRRGHALWVKGNHERSLLRSLRSNQPIRTSETYTRAVDQIRERRDAFALSEYLKVVLASLPTHLVTAHTVAVHAAMRQEWLLSDAPKAESFALYTRDNWTWDGQQTLVHGHVVVDAVTRRRSVLEGQVLGGEVVSIDTGAFQGGPLTAFLAPAGRSVSVPADSRDLAPSASRV